MYSVAYETPVTGLYPTAILTDSGTNFYGFSDGSCAITPIIVDNASSVANFYGTTQTGDANGDGAIFEILSGANTQTVLAHFDNTVGTNPAQNLTADSAGNVYGVMQAGGANSDGSVFEVQAGSGTVSTLVSFSESSGSSPTGGLIVDAAGDLFGTTFNGGPGLYGTVFEVLAGSGTITTLVSFAGTNGAHPWGNLIADAAGNLYGTTATGGANSYGIAYKLSNTGFTVPVIPLLSDTASVSAGLNSPSLTFNGTPQLTALGVGPHIVTFALASSSGVDLIANFKYLTDALNIDLAGAATTALQAADTTYNGQNAVALYSSADPSHGIVLTNVAAGITAADLLANHLTFSGGHALIT